MTRGYSGESPYRRSRIVVPVASPAAGADWTVAVPAGHLWEPVAVSATLVTSAAVATRVARLLFSDGNFTFADCPPFATQAASLTRRYLWLVSPTGVAQGAGVLSSMPDLCAMAGWAIRTTTDLIDAADQWSAIMLHVRDITTRGGDANLDDYPDMIMELVGAGLARIEG